jgi:hypothetical protein
MSTLVVRWVHNSSIASQVEGINLIHCQVQKNDVDEEVGRLQARQTVFVAPELVQLWLFYNTLGVFHLLERGNGFTDNAPKRKNMVFQPPKLARSMSVQGDVENPMWHTQCQVYSFSNVFFKSGILKPYRMTNCRLCCSISFQHTKIDTENPLPRKIYFHRGLSISMFVHVDLLEDSHSKKTSWYPRCL